MEDKENDYSRDCDTDQKGLPGYKQRVFCRMRCFSVRLVSAKYFLARNAKRLRTELIVANEFNYDPPVTAGKESIVITCSLGGTTPETVEAAKKARKMGAPVICLSNEADSPLVKNSDYAIVHGFYESYSAKMEKLTKCLELAAEILNQYEGYEDYGDMMEGTKKIYGLIEDSIPYAKPLAKKFAEEHKDEKIIYIMSSGPTQQIAYSFSSFFLMEMQGSVRHHLMPVNISMGRLR